MRRPVPPFSGRTASSSPGRREDAPRTRFSRPPQERAGRNEHIGRNDPESRQRDASDAEKSNRAAGEREGQSPPWRISPARDRVGDTSRRVRACRETKSAPEDFRDFSVAPRSACPSNPPGTGPAHAATGGADHTSQVGHQPVAPGSASHAAWTNKLRAPSEENQRPLGQREHGRPQAQALPGEQVVHHTCVGGTVEHGNMSPAAPGTSASELRGGDLPTTRDSGSAVFAGEPGRCEQSPDPGVDTWPCRPASGELVA